MFTETQKTKLVERAEARLDEFDVAITVLEKFGRRIDSLRGDVLGEYRLDFQIADKTCSAFWSEIETALDGLGGAIEAIRELMEREEKKLARVDEW